MRIENIPETKRNIEIQLQNAVKRPVSASFSHLGKHKTHSIAIQTTLFEFDEEATGPKGTMYLTLNTSLLQDKHELAKVIKEITNKYKSD